MTYAQEQRIRLIDILLVSYGSVGRRPLMDFFGIAPACATKDLTTYKTMYPANMIYDVVSKSYVKAPGFKRAYQ